MSGWLFFQKKLHSLQIDVLISVENYSTMKKPLYEAAPLLGMQLDNKKKQTFSWVAADNFEFVGKHDRQKMSMSSSTCLFQKIYISPPGFATCFICNAWQRIFACHSVYVLQFYPIPCNSRLYSGHFFFWWRGASKTFGVFGTKVGCSPAAYATMVSPSWKLYVTTNDGKMNLGKQELIQ